MEIPSAVGCQTVHLETMSECLTTFQHGDSIGCWLSDSAPRDTCSGVAVGAWCGSCSTVLLSSKLTGLSAGLAAVHQSISPSVHQPIQPTPITKAAVHAGMALQVVKAHKSRPMSRNRL